MTLGNIDGRSIDSILQRIPNTSLRQAYHDALESLVAERGAGVLQNSDSLLAVLDTHCVNSNNPTHSIDSFSFYSKIAQGNIHGNQYVAAAYVLAAISGSRPEIQVDPGLFRINPLWQEHLTYLNLFEDVQQVHGHFRETSPSELTITIGSAPPIVRGAQSYIRYVNQMNPADVQAWASLETYRDSGLPRQFADLEYRFQMSAQLDEDFRVARGMTRAQFLDFMESFEAGAPKSEPDEAHSQTPQTPVQNPVNLSPSSPSELEPPCAPDDPSCQNEES